MAARKILWSPRAARSYSTTIRFILKTWTLKEARTFDEKLEKFISLITSSTTNLSMLGNPKGKFYHFVLSKQTTLVYKFLADGSIELVAFLDNRRGKKKL